MRVLRHAPDGTKAIIDNSTGTVVAPAAPEPEPAKIEEPPPPAEPEPNNDDGDENEQIAEMVADGTDANNARRLVADHGEDLHYVHAWRRWLTWNSTVWALDNTGEIQRRAKTTARGILIDTLDEVNGNTKDPRLARALRAQSANGIGAMIALAQSEPGIPVLPEQLDSDPMLFAMANGVIDLENGHFHDHHRDDLTTKHSPVAYDVRAHCPIWETFIRWAMGGDDELVLFMQRWCGYTLTGCVDAQVVPFWHGEGANGKTTAAVTLQRLFGPYSAQLPADLLLEKRGERHPTEIALLKGARLALCSELDEGRPLAEARLKALSGGDVVTARRMREDYWEFQPTHKLIVITNHQPRVRGQDHALWRRILLVPWTQTVRPEQQDPRLPEKLATELPGILNWCLEGLRAWKDAGLQPPAAVRNATNKYQEAEDSVARWIDETCTRDPQSSESASALRRAYLGWAKSNAERAVTDREFGQRLTRAGFDRKHRRDGWHWRGITMIQPEITFDDLLSPQRGSYDN